ncbi:MAG: oxaloacetate decarboxylase subunit alpha [Methanobacteriota archaeon]|nr:MAG: oxaloacetate decarboxylase subunit alpha [Euryarchaeota archaeon]
MPKVRITDLTLRDAHQSLLATRMRTRDMLPILEQMDEVGFYSMEVWGGATFDCAMRYLNEDPWERIRSIKRGLEKTPTQMLLRGQNLVGYRHYPDDIVEKFVVLAAKNGVDIFRIFDAMNDVRNMELAIRTALKQGAHVQGAISYTTSPVHTLDAFAKMAVELEALGCHSLCIKDMSGIITPKDAYNLIKRLKEDISIPIDLHSHCTSGMALMAYQAACEAGVDILDCVFSPLSQGTSFPPVESVVAALQGTECDTGIKLESLTRITPYFAEIREKYAALINPVSERVDVNVLQYQIPGGMLSNLVSQLKEQNALDRFEEVLKETPRVRKDLGYPPLVTPTSQVVGIQAVMNVLTGERYKVIPNEVKEYVKGMYGRIPGEIDPELKKKILGDEEPITVRPADLLEPQLQSLAKEAETMGIIKSEEDLLSYALFPAIAVKFLRGEIEEEKLEPPKKEAALPKDALPTEFLVEIDGEEYDVRVTPTGYTEIERAVKKRPKEGVEGGITTNMQGIILKINVNVGDNVKEGDVVAVIEAMKMENEIVAPYSGVVEDIFVSVGDTINSGDVIMVIK